MAKKFSIFVATLHPPTSPSSTPRSCWFVWKDKDNSKGTDISCHLWSGSPVPQSMYITMDYDGWYGNVSCWLSRELCQLVKIIGKKWPAGIDRYVRYTHHTLSLAACYDRRCSRDRQTWARQCSSLMSCHRYCVTLLYLYWRHRIDVGVELRWAVAKASLNIMDHKLRYTWVMVGSHSGDPWHSPPVIKNEKK